MKRKIFLVIIPLLLFFLPLNAFADGSVNCDRICMNGGNVPNGWCPNQDQKEFTIPALSQNVQIGFLQIFPYSHFNLNTGETLTVSILIREKYGKPMDDYSVFQGGIAMLYGDQYTSILNQVDSNIYDLSGNYLYDQAHALSYHINAILYVIKLEAKSNISDLGSLAFRSNLFLGSSFTNSDTIVINATIYKGSKNYTDILLENLVSSMGADSSNIASIKNGVDSVNNTLNDDSTSSSQSSSSSFFNNFSVNNHGLTGVVLAPVNFIQSFTNTCQPVTLTLFNKDIPLPCGDTIFWGKSDSRISNFRNIWNVLIGGPIIYALLLSIYRSIHKAMDPDKNEEGGLDL